MDDSKRAYERARTILEEALDALQRRFLDEATGLYADVFDRTIVAASSS